MRERYEKDLRRLLIALPHRFHSLTQDALEAMPSIMSLPKILLHKDFSICNIIVDDKTGHLTGVIDWAEAEIEPLGLNLHLMQQITGHFHMRTGWRRYTDYNMLKTAFWQILQEQVGGLSRENIRAIKAAMVLGLLLSRGCTSRLANMPEPVPIADETGAYNMLHLHGVLIEPSTKFVDRDRVFD